MRVLPENRTALGLVRDLTPIVRVRFGGGDYEARLDLSDVVRPRAAHHA